jgi:two-component system phosphate regulon sensor histidine kinase PhoR
VVRFRAPAVVQLRRAQLTLMLATLVPTILMTAIGIGLLAAGSHIGAVVAGVLVVAFCTTSLTGYILGSIFVSRGASVARFQNDFLSSVSHELRTPLTSISMFIETLRDDRLTDPTEKRKCLELLDQEVQRLSKLVERLINLSRMEAGRHTFERGAVRVDEIVREALIAFDASTLSEQVEVDVTIEDDLLVVGDRSALAQALANLLVNAWKYTPSGDKQIGLTARASGREVEISILDNGPGIPKQEQRRIFDQFERGQAAVDGKRAGSGLGLAIVRAIVRGHRGRVDVRSPPGRGAEFRIRLRRQGA